MIFPFCPQRSVSFRSAHARFRPRTVTWALLLVSVMMAWAPAGRANPSEVNLIKNGTISTDAGNEWPAEWLKKGPADGARVVVLPVGDGEEPRRVFEFSRPNASAQQVIALKPDWWKLELRFRMKTEQVRPGAADWRNARMALRYVDPNWKTVAPWPKNVGLQGTHDWAEKVVTLTIPNAATSLVVELAMFGESGTVWFSDISLRVVARRPEKTDAESPFGPGVDPWSFDAAWRTSSATRERVSLNGYWKFFPIHTKPFDGSAAADKLPKEGEGWGFFKVPGIWSSENRNEQPVIYSPWIEFRLAEEKVAKDAFSQAWYKRRIDIPDTWAGSRVVLRLEDVQGHAKVFVDGRAAGEIGWPGGELDLTAHATPGRSHELVLLVSDQVSAENPYLPLSFKERLASGASVRGKNRGLCGDAWLTSLPDPAKAGPQLGQILVRTSVREGTIAFRTPFVAPVDGAALADLVLRAEIFDTAGRKVKTVESNRGVLSEAKPCAEAPLPGERIVTWGGAWRPGSPDGPSLWSLEHPNLYTARVAVVRRDRMSGAERILDETLPVRFGFREFSIAGQHMYLNGTRKTLIALQIRNNMHPSSYMAGMDVCRDTISNIKELGGNFATLHNYQVEPGQTGHAGNLFRAADEMGLMLSLTLPHARSYGWELDKPEVRASYARLSRWLIEQYGNHPSIVMYATSHNSLYNQDINPLKANVGEWAKADETLYMDQVNKTNLSGRRRQAFTIIDPLVGVFDPSRIVYHHSAGNDRTMITHNDYPNWSPPQERAEFRAYWAEHGQKPLFLIEYGLPHTASFTSYRGPHFIYNKAALDDPKWWLDSEYAAAFFNQESYRTSAKKAESRRAHIQRLLSGKPAGWGKLKEATNYYDVLALHMRQFMPAFRTFGVSFQLWDMEELWERDPDAPRQWHPGDRERTVEVADVSAPGIRPDYHGLAWQRVYDRPGGSFWLETSATREMRRWKLPVLAYLGGGDPDIAGFTERSHNFGPGDAVKKQVVVVNDSEHPVECRYAWRLEGAGLSGSGHLRVAPGEQARAPVEFTLPQHLAAGRHMLAVDFTFDTEAAQSDSMAIDVLAPVEKGRRGSVALFDPVGDSAKTLTRLGIEHTRYTSAAALPRGEALLNSGTLLVIGRGALSEGVKLPQLTAVHQGLNVLVFEQTETALQRIGGFRTQTLRVRNVFARVPGHPALSGIADAHLADWHGDSSLIDKFENSRDTNRDQPSTDWCGFRNARVWHTSNRGAVATVLIEKPSVGDFLPLVDCGFDLQYSPLIEWRPAARGSMGGRQAQTPGRMLLCQLDVTERTRPDPAADRLIINIVDSLRERVSVRNRPLVYAGDARGRELLKTLGFVAEAYDRKTLSDDAVLVLGPGAPVIDNLDKRVATGLRVLTIGLGKADLVRQWPERFASAEETELVPSWMDAEALGVAEFAGISNAQTHWWAFPRSVALPDSPDAKGNNVLQRVGMGRGVIVFSQGAPWFFDGDDRPWERTTWRQSVFLVSRLLHNLGASARNTGALETLLANGTTGRAKPWINTHYRQTPVQSDDPYIYYRW